MKQVSMILRSKVADLNIFAESLEDANTAVREYIGLISGGLTESELANADEWTWKWIERDGDPEIQILYGHEIPEEHGGGIDYEVVNTVSIESYL
jgi:hypothetical protein